MIVICRLIQTFSPNHLLVHIVKVCDLLTVVTAQTYFYKHLGHVHEPLHAISD